MVICFTDVILYFPKLKLREPKLLERKEPLLDDRLPKTELREPKRLPVLFLLLVPNDDPELLFAPVVELDDRLARPNPPDFTDLR